MKNNDIVNYRGYQIKKINGADYQCGSNHYKTYREAQQSVDTEIEEEQAMKQIDNYVFSHFGGWY